MKYVLFIGSKLGFEAIKVLTELKCKITHVFIEKDHNHEHEKYYRKSIALCKTCKISHSINVNDHGVTKTINKIGEFDYVMSFGYRRLISPSIINKASIAALGTHFSPLPRYRGFAPLNWVLINGENHTAVNLFYLSKEVDSGDIVGKELVGIDYGDDINSLMEKCLLAFRVLMSRAVPMLENKSFVAEKQDNSKATYTCPRGPEDGLIYWDWSSERVYNMVRALTFPYPGAFTFYKGEKMHIWSCIEYVVPLYEGRISGKIIKIIKDVGVVVLCGRGAVLVKDIQLQNKEWQTADKIICSVRASLG